MANDFNKCLECKYKYFNELALICINKNKIGSIFTDNNCPYFEREVIENVRG